jgi:nucleoside-diphosphate-sugar epimerase
VRAFVTGGAGFIGRVLVGKLRARGDDVRGLARSDASASALRALGCDVAIGDLSDRAWLASVMTGCDAAFHLAGDYRVGIGRRERPAMHAANVTGTTTLLDAATDAGVTRTVYVSTINAFGDTRYRVVDETYERLRPYRYVSYYDETKHLAHEIARARIAGGAPVLIAQPGGVYGPGDHSELGGMMRQAAAGRLRAVTFGDAGMNFLHVEDAAAGVLAVHDRGVIGEAYVLGGEIATLGEVVRRIAAITGRRPPRLATPTWLLRALAPIGPLIGPAMAGRPNLRELLSASAGVTYWATDAKARREIGYAPRDLETGLREVFGAAERG